MEQEVKRLLKAQVVNLVPPTLNEQTISAKIACVRPMREGTFNISSEIREKQFVVHCYGHGGCGWTTFMGSVERAIELLQMRYPIPALAPSIRIIGAGCMGLCSAVELALKGYKIAGVIAEKLYDITSWNAGGYFGLVSVIISPEEMASVNKINLSTFVSYQKIKEGKHPYFSPQTVRYLPVYCSAETDSGVEALELKGLIPPREIVDIDFGNGVIHRNFNKFMTCFFDGSRLMQELHKEIQRLEIPLAASKVDNFQELEEEIVFNCAGLGGGKLANDSKMLPMRGHLLLLNESAGQEHMDYMIYSKVKGGFVYMFPRTMYLLPNGQPTRCFGVLGGTFIPDTEEQIKLDNKEFNALLQRNIQFFHKS